MAHFFKEHFFGGGGFPGQSQKDKDVDTTKLYETLNVAKTAT